MHALIGLNGMLYESMKHIPSSTEVADNFMNFSLGIIHIRGVFSP